MTQAKEGKHIFLLDITEGNKEHNRYALEAVKEFLALFPEHKDKFEIHVRAGDKFCKVPYSELNKDNPKLEEVDYKEYKTTGGEDITTTRGIDSEAVNRWLFNNARKDNFFHYICPTAESINGGLFYGMSDRLNPATYDRASSEDKKKYSQTSYVAVNINRGKEQFKSILKHELGHAFHATHDGRANIKGTDAGCHCNNDGCLMQDGRENAVRQGKAPDFCQDCIKSMRKYMNSLFNDNSHTMSPQEREEELPPNTEVDDSFKTPWREFAQKVKDALGEGAELEEDEKSSNFKATITKDGVTTSIIASSANDVALGAKKADGSEEVPPMEVFKELAKKALKEDKNINFYDIKTPDFKARLLLACLEEKVSMKNEPQITDEFLSQIKDKNIMVRLKKFREQGGQESLNVSEVKTEKQTPSKPTADRGAQRIIISKGRV